MINLKCNTLSRIFLASLTFIVFCPTVPVSAQQIVMGRAMVAGGGEPKQMQAALDGEIKQIKSVQEQRMTTTIDDLKRVCELSDEQVTKLQVAAKGAIEKSLESTRKQYSEMLQQFGMFNGVAVEAEEVVDDGPGPPDESNADAEQTDAEFTEVDEAEFAEGAWQMAVGMDLGFIRQNIEANGGEFATPEKEKIWTNAISKTLTEQQAGKYAEALTARMARVRRAAVEAFVAKVDAELLLQDSQRDELVKLVNDKYGIALQKDILCSFRRGFFQTSNSSVSKIDKEVRKLFSDSQFHVWKAKFAGELEKLAAMNGEPIANEGGILNFLFGR